MSEFQIKNKVISFRVSDEEYRTVERLSWKAGFASVALFVRAAALKDTPFECMQTPGDAAVYRLSGRLEGVAMVLEKLAGRIQQTLDSPAQSSCDLSAVTD